MTPSMRELIRAEADSFEDYDWAVKLCTEAVRRAVQYQYPWIHQHPTTLDHVLAAVMGDPEGEKR